MSREWGELGGHSEREVDWEKIGFSRCHVGSQ